MTKVKINPSSVFSQESRSATLEFTRPLDVDYEAINYPNADLITDKTYWVAVNWGVFDTRTEF